MKKANKPGVFANGRSRRQAEKNRRHIRQNRAHLYAEKKRRGCEISGRSVPPENLDAHHHPPRNGLCRPISHELSRPPATFVRMLAQCILVDRSVHRMMHGGR